jgi:transposase
MRSIRQILYYRLEKGISAEQTALALKVSKGTVINTVKRFFLSGMTWPLAEDVTDSTLQERLYPPAAGTEVVKPELPSIVHLEQELAKKHVTLQ